MTQPVSLELISLWTLTGVTSWVVNTLILTHVAGQAAFIDVCAGTMETQIRERRFIPRSRNVFICIHLLLYNSACESAFTLAGGHVVRQLVAVVALAEEGADEVVAVMLTGAVQVTLIHIWNKCTCYTLDTMRKIILSCGFMIQPKSDGAPTHEQTVNNRALSKFWHLENKNKAKQ